MTERPVGPKETAPGERDPHDLIESLRDSLMQLETASAFADRVKQDCLKLVQVAAQQAARIAALEAGFRDEPFGDGLVDLLSRATKCLWGQKGDDPIELGRILSGRALRIKERAAALLREKGNPWRNA